MPTISNNHAGRIWPAGGKFPTLALWIEFGCY